MLGFYHLNTEAEANAICVGGAVVVVGVTVAVDIAEAGRVGGIG